jgi:hypothetical protein
MIKQETYEGHRKILTDQINTTRNPRPLWSSEERVRAAQELSSKVDIKILLIADHYFLCARNFFDEDCPEVAELMKLTLLRNRVPYLEFHMYYRVIQAAIDYFGEKLYLEDVLQRSWIPTAIQIVQAVTRQGPDNITHRPLGRPIKTLLDIIKSLKIKDC